MAGWHKQLNEEVLETAASRYGVSREQLNKIGGFENVVFELRRDGDEPVILRFSHTDHRSLGQIQAELHWVDDLAARGVSVCRPLPSSSGTLVEVIHSQGGQFMTTAFQKAKGARVHSGHDEWGPALFTEWGRITGQMHACAKTYTIPDDAPSRKRSGPPADESEPEGPAALAYSRYKQAAEQIRALAGRDRDSYGICHRDLHQGNFFVHEGRMTAFDFDDCGDDYFVQDIAMAVYYATVFPSWQRPVYDDKEASYFANMFINRFMDGYASHNSLNDRWLKQLPLFIEKRRSFLCAILHDEWTAKPGNPEQLEWLRRNMEAIGSGVPCFHLTL